MKIVGLILVVVHDFVCLITMMFGLASDSAAFLPARAEPVPVPPLLHVWLVAVFLVHLLIALRLLLIEPDES